MQLKIELTDETDDAGRELFRLTDDFHCKICDGFSVVIPAGFVTNFGSVPRFFYRVLRPIELRSASVVHDYLLNELPERQSDFLPMKCSRWIADAVFFELLRRSGFGLIRSTVVWSAVRLFSIVANK